MRILLIDLYYKRTQIREVNWKTGGSELTRMLLKEYPSSVVIAPGLLTGTRAPTGGRYSIGAVTKNGIHIGNVGGFIGTYIKGYDYSAIVFLKESIGPVTVEISKDFVSFQSAFPYLGKGTKEVTESVEKGGIKSIVVGPAGEMGSKLSAVVAEGMRIVGRGMGEALFRKGIKLLTFEPAVYKFQNERFMKIANEIKTRLKAVDEGVRVKHPCYGCPIKCVAFDERGKKGNIRVLSELGIPELDQQEIVDLANDKGVDLFAAAYIAKIKMMDIKEVIEAAASGEDWNEDLPKKVKNDWEDYLDTIGICASAATYLSKDLIERLVKAYMEVVK